MFRRPSLIAALRSKDDLAKLLADKQAVIKQAKALEEAAKNAAPQTDLSGLTVAQLKDMAKQRGVSLNLTKSDVIGMLDALEPHIDHYNYSGKTLIAAKQKHGIPPLKNKEQLVKALEKAAGLLRRFVLHLITRRTSGQPLLNNHSKGTSILKFGVHVQSADDCISDLLR